jgi:hypothetical protein
VEFLVSILYPILYPVLVFRMNRRHSITPAFIAFFPGIAAIDAEMAIRSWSRVSTGSSSLAAGAARSLAISGTPAGEDPSRSYLLHSKIRPSLSLKMQQTKLVGIAGRCL